MPDFAAQIKAWAEKTEEKLEDVDVAFKLGLFGMVVRNTRVADPASWQRPDPSYVGGTMRGGWQVTTGAPAATQTGQINQSLSLPGDEVSKILPFSDTYLSNNVSYVRVYEEEDAMVGRAIADAMRILENEVKKQ